MKKKIASVFLMAGLLFSCSDDDNSMPVNNNGDSLAGKYNLTSVTLPAAVDFNQDGTASLNLMDESSCYLGSYIELKDNNTYIAEDNSVLLNSELECNTQDSEGTWTSAGEELILTNTLTEPNLETNFAIVGNQLKMFLENAPYPDRDADGNEVYSTGNVILIYTKAE